MKAFRIRPYRDPKRPHLKFVVNTTTLDDEGRKQRARSFFETRAAAAGFAQQKSVELANGGLEAVQFPVELRVMALQADAMLKPYGKTILDAARHYGYGAEAAVLAVLQRLKRDRAIREIDPAH